MNPYNENLCKSIVDKKYLSKILKKFGTSTLLFYDKSLAKNLHTKEDLENLYKSRGAVPTPRCMQSIKIYSCALYYYIDYILQNNPHYIADIGCGENFFTGIIDGVYGVEPEGNYADSNEYFDVEGNYATNHLGEFDAAISINSIHFISLASFATQVKTFSTIIKKGGRGFLSMNTARMVDKTPEVELIKMFGSTQPTKEQLHDYINKEIEKIDLSFIVIDNLANEVYDEWLDGNIRLVFQV